VKEVYFTGGEPFLHPEFSDILEDTLREAPCTVLTNGTLFTRTRLETLRRLSDATPYALEIRVSLDGVTAAAHDAFRGNGAFERTLDGLRLLEDAGMLPIVTLTQNTDEDSFDFCRRAIAALRDAGLSRPRLKVLPMFLLGREAGRTRGYDADETLAGMPATTFDPERLQCSSCRAVTSQGVFACPLLVDEPGGRMGERLDQALGPFEVRHGACYTCWVTGMSCSNS
jgi:hypothetical protein